MGSTLTALQTQPGVAFRWVLAIEGLEYLVTNANLAAAVTAWAATEHTEAIGGLFVEGGFEQTLDPWEPIQPGSDLAFIIRDEDGTDLLGATIGRSTGGDETWLPDTIDAADTTVGVLDATTLASSGTVHIGTELIAYSGKSSNDLTGCDRGLFAPFKAGTETEQRFGRYHRAGAADQPQGQFANPRVTELPRTWIGRWVGLWLHREVGGVLDVRDQAQCVFAGKIAEVRDTATGDTRIVAKHVLSVISETVLLRDQWQAEIQQGVYLQEGTSFSFKVLDYGSGTDEANDLDVVTGASGANEIEAGYHEVASLIEKLNHWLAAETAALRIPGKYRFREVALESGEPRIVFKYEMGATGEWTLEAPYQALVFLGFDISAQVNRGLVTAGARAYIHATDSGDLDEYTAQEAYYDTLPWVRYMANGGQMNVVNPVGVFIDQAESMPTAARAYVDDLPLEPWGLIEIDGAIFVAALTSSTSFGKMRLVPELQFLGRGVTQDDLNKGAIGRRATGGEPEPMIVRQIFLAEGALDDLLPALLASTGTTGYNHGTHDSLGYGLGAAVPWELLGDRFVESCRRLDASSTSNAIYVVIDKSVRLSEVVGPELLLRRAHLVWRGSGGENGNGGLVLTSWSTPTASLAVHTLTEDNKAAPVDQRDDQRSPVDLTEQWLRNIIEIQFNRVVGEDTYRNSITLEDRPSIDDHGEARLVRIKARNTYGEYASTGDSVKSLAPGILAWMPFFSRPLRLMRRTIDLSLFEDVAPGDIVSVTDRFARDPATGLRGMTGQAGLIVAHRWTPGGRDPGDPSSVIPMEGEVDIALIDLDVFAWSPAAMVDDTANTEGFTAGYDPSVPPAIRCKTNEYTLAADGVRDTDYFAVNDEITIVEVDPAGGSSQSWDRTIVSIIDNDLTLSSALTGFDTAKKYRVIPDKYADVGANQRGRAFQADAADALIQDIAQAHRWGADATDQVNAAPAFTLADLPERYSSRAHDDGAALDVGFETGLVRMVTNLQNYKTAPQCAVLDNALRLISVTALTWELLAVIPYYVGPALYPQGYTRRLYVAPNWSSLLGASVSVRISLCRTPPTGESRTDVNRGQLKSEATFTTSSTTAAIPAVQGLRTEPARADGECFIVVEINHSQAIVVGMGALYLGPLEAI
jgi:hypothetical protein